MTSTQTSVLRSPVAAADVPIAWVIKHAKSPVDMAGLFHLAKLSDLWDGCLRRKSFLRNERYRRHIPKTKPPASHPKRSKLARQESRIPLLAGTEGVIELVIEFEVAYYDEYAYESAAVCGGGGCSCSDCLGD